MFLKNICVLVRPASMLAGRTESGRRALNLVYACQGNVQSSPHQHACGQHNQNEALAVGRSIHLPHRQAKAKRSARGVCRLPGPARAQLELTSVARRGGRRGGEGTFRRRPAVPSLEFLAKSAARARMRRQAGRLCRWALPARLAPLFPPPLEFKPPSITFACHDDV